jgi:hypothetical protein
MRAAKRTPNGRSLSPTPQGLLCAERTIPSGMAQVEADQHVVGHDDIGLGAYQFSSTASAIWTVNPARAGGPRTFCGVIDPARFNQAPNPSGRVSRPAREDALLSSISQRANWFRYEVSRENSAQRRQAEVEPPTLSCFECHSRSSGPRMIE